jgi:vomeronasal 2 receptor
MMHLFLKKTHFNNPGGEQVILDDKRRSEAAYDITDSCNFPGDLRLKVKVGKFSPYAPHGQQFSLSDDMIERATGSILFLTT